MTEPSHPPLDAALRRLSHSFETSAVAPDQIMRSVLARTNTVASRSQLQQETIMSQDPIAPPPATKPVPARRRAYATGSASVAFVAIIALLAVFVFSTHHALVHPNGATTGTTTTTYSDPTATPIPTPIAVSNIDHGVQIKIFAAYADPSRTSIYFGLHRTDIIDGGSGWTLYDASGHAYQDMFGAGGGVDADNQYVSDAEYCYFAPLPASLLVTPQRLTLVVTVMQIFVKHSQPTNLTGHWHVAFTITPSAMPLVPLSATPITKHNITVRPLSIQTTSPGTTPMDGMASGTCLDIQISGLPAKEPIDNMTAIDSSYQIKNATIGEQWGRSGGGVKGLLDSMEPGAVAINNSAAPSGQIGASGTVVVQLLFFAPVTKQQVSFTLDKLVVMLKDYNYLDVSQLHYVQGPWDFTINL